MVILQGTFHAPKGLSVQDDRCLFSIQSKDGCIFCQASSLIVNPASPLKHGRQVRVIGYLRSFINQRRQQMTFVEVVAISTHTIKDLWDQNAIPAVFASLGWHEHL
jgi:hypothetical protein